MWVLQNIINWFLCYNIATTGNFDASQKMIFGNLPLKHGIITRNKFYVFYFGVEPL